MKLINVLILIPVICLMASCNAPEDSDWWKGKEYMTYYVDGKVTDKDGNPVAKIAVATAHCEDTVYTNSSGYYHVTGTCAPLSAVEVSFTDVDSLANGGFFRKTFCTASLVLKGEGRLPYLGRFGAEGMDVTMLPNEEDIVTPVPPTEVE